jgi:hypothetical protein
MGIGVSIFLIALGAILRWAVHASSSGFSIHTAGTILLIVGIAGLVLSLLYTMIWAGRRDRGGVVREREVL